MKRKPTTQFNTALMLLLGRLLQNGFSLQQAFTFMPVVFPKQQAWLSQVNQNLAQGNRLAPSLAAMQFPSQLVAQIELTELQGNLGECLLHLGQLQRIRQKRRREMAGLIAYPCFLLVFLGGLIGAMQVYLLPEIAQFNPADTGQSPLQTLAQICGIGCLISAGLLGGGYLIWHRLPLLTRLKHAFKWPLIGRTLQNYYQYCLLFDLATCLQNGLNLTEMGQLAQKLAPTSWLVRLMVALERDLQKGTSLLTCLAANPFYPAELRLVLAKGSAMQQMTKEIDLLATLKYNEVQRQLQRKLNWIQPILFIIIGIIIICTYLSILMPLYHTMEGIA